MLFSDNWVIFTPHFISMFLILWMSQAVQPFTLISIYIYATYCFYGFSFIRLAVAVNLSPVIM